MKTRVLIALLVVVGWAGVCCAGWLSHGPYSDLSGFVPVDGYAAPLNASEGKSWTFGAALLYTNEYYAELPSVALNGGTVNSGPVHAYGPVVQLYPGTSTYDADGGGSGGRLYLFGGSVLYHYWDSVWARDRSVTAYGPRMYFDAPGSVLTNAGPLGTVLHQGALRILAETVTINGNAVLTTSNAASGFMIRYGTQLVFVAGTVTNVIDSDLVTP